MVHTLLHLLQRFGLSVAFFWLAWIRLSPMLDPDAWSRVLAIVLTSPTSAQGILSIEQVVQNVLLVAFNVLVGTLLLFLRKPDKPPERVVHVVVPLVATFSYMAYGFIQFLPSVLHETRVLPSLGLVGVIVTGLLVIAAYALSFSALLYLRRSFAVFVEVRRGVTAGPYRWIRHPMYLGYVLVVVALFLSQPTAAFLLVSVVLLVVTYVRARLEETMLTTHVPGYAGYAERTGMIFPRLHSSG